MSAFGHFRFRKDICKRLCFLISKTRKFVYTTSSPGRSYLPPRTAVALHGTKKRRKGEYRIP